MSLIDITPAPTFTDEYDLGTYYYAEGCDIADCTSPLSSYLVLLDDEELTMCDYHYQTLR